MVVRIALQQFMLLFGERVRQHFFTPEPDPKKSAHQAIFYTNCTERRKE